MWQWWRWRRITVVQLKMLQLWTERQTYSRESGKMLIASDVVNPHEPCITLDTDRCVAMYKWRHLQEKPGAGVPILLECCTYPLLFHICADFDQRFLAKCMPCSEGQNTAHTKFNFAHAGSTPGAHSAPRIHIRIGIAKWRRGNGKGRTW